MNNLNKILFIALGTMLIAACSTPKYTYQFDRYDYNSGRKATVIAEDNQLSPLAVDPAMLSADVVDAPVGNPTHEIQDARNTLAKKYNDMSKTERKEFRQQVKKEFKQYVKAMRKGDMNAPSETEVMDNDLKLAIIFGAVGLTLSLFGGINEAFWILGVIAIVVGVVFLIKWLVRQ